MHTCWMLRRWWRSVHMHTCGMLRRWCRSLHMHTCLMLRSTGVGWGGVGMLTFLAHAHMFDATEMMTFLAHAHMFDATEHWGGVGWGGDVNVPCTCTHVWCYGDDVVPCTWTHVWCYGALTPRGAHIAGLSAVHIHRNLGFENVVQCFVKYIHHVRDTIPPASAFVDQTWLQS